MLWHIGNTTVRTPYRLAEALKVLAASPLAGNLSGREQEQAFAELLHESDVVEVARIADGEDASDLGRKWRSALSQLGFITPQLTRGIASGTPDPSLVEAVEGIEGLTGRAYEITQNGLRLASSESVIQQQECFLRSLATYRIPSVIETRYKTEQFSPLAFVLDVFNELDSKGEEARISFEEFALYIQTGCPSDGLDAVVTDLLEYRHARKSAAGQVRAFDRERYTAVADTVARKQQTLDDYADVNFRYLKATGLFRTSGRGLVISPLKQELANLLRDQVRDFSADEVGYLQSLWNGAALPTDDPENAITVLLDLTDRLQAAGETVEEVITDLAPADLEIERHKLEERLQRLDEETFAKDQASKVEEILAWMDVISTRRNVVLADGTVLAIPKGEYPAYLEWIVWRAFLAMNSLVKPPWECRNFDIDQDFLPVHCAAAGRPDMVFEFANAVIVVEVTLTRSSRQEAAEGEPVRRHVAEYAEQFVDDPNKRVFGLFIAIDIDSNTAHTFRYGEWYRKDDSKIVLDIVPMQLLHFQAMLRSGQSDLAALPERLVAILKDCRSWATQEAPEWKRKIAQTVETACQ